MVDDCKKVNENYKSQTKTEKEKINWISMEEIKEVYNHLKTKVDEMIKNKMIHHNTYIDFLLVALLSGVIVPPRRSLDYALMKVKNFDEKTENYIKNSKFYFNQYKTSKKYGEQTLAIPKELLGYIKKWTKFQSNEYLLFSSNNKHLSSSQITKHLNRIFGGKNISVDILRHVYLSNYYKDIPKVKEMENLASSMGHSISTAINQYIKKD
jgi:integrase